MLKVTGINRPESENYRILIVDDTNAVRLEMHRLGKDGSWVRLTLEEARHIAAQLMNAAARVEKANA